MTITNGYCTRPEAASYIGMNPDGADSLDDVITAVSRLIDNYAGRHFFQQAATARKFEVSGWTELDLGPYNDLVSVTTLKVDADGDNTFATTISSTNYVLEPVNAAVMPEPWPYTELCLINGYTFPITPASSGREYLIEVTGTWGWPSVPATVKRATLLLVHEVAKLSDAPFGIAGINDFGLARISSDMPRHVRTMLGPYRHPGAFGIG